MTENDNLPGTPPEDSTPDAPAPAPKRRPRKPAAAGVEAVPDAVTAESATAADAPPPRPRRRRSAAADAPVAEGAADAAVESATVMPAGPAEGEGRTDTATAAQVADATEGEVADGAGEEGEGRRGRNRRRGRGKERGERPAGEEGAPRAAAPVAPEVDAAETAARFDEVLSGAYDAEAPEPDDEASLEAAAKRVLRPDPDAPKLHKVLAQSGIGSRRDMEQLIEDGHVTVNDQPAHVGQRVSDRKSVV